MNKTAAIASVKRAMVRECVKLGITDHIDISDLCLDAVNGIGEMSVAAYKAHATMRHNNRISFRKVKPSSRQR